MQSTLFDTQATANLQHLLNQSRASIPTPDYPPPSTFPTTTLSPVEPIPSLTEETLLTATTNHLKANVSHFDSPVKIAPDATQASIRQTQTLLEADGYEAAVREYNDLIQSAQNRNDPSSLAPVQAEFLRWFIPLATSLETEQTAILTNTTSKDRSNYGPLLLLLPPQKLAVITMHTTVNAVISNGNEGATFTNVITAIGNAVRAELGVRKLFHDAKDGEEGKTGKSTKFKDKIIQDLYKLSGSRKLSMIIKRSERLLDDENYKWSDDLKAKVGAYLVKVFIDTAETRSGDPAFNFVTKYVGKKKQQGFVQCDPSLFSSLMDASLKNSFHIRHLPMVVPPVPWTGPTTGSYLVNESVIMRTRGCRQQLKALEFADMSLVYDGLNALGSTPWRINTGILGLQMEAWRNKMTVGELPSQSHVAIPDAVEYEQVDFVRTEDGKTDKSDPMYSANLETFMKQMHKQRSRKRAEQKNRELHSLRCDTLIKLNQAAKFRDAKIYFPWNLDFRGRAYPIPPNLNHLGSDLCRGLLMFDKKMPLTARGVYWLKVNIANLYGMNKISMDEREAFVDEHYEIIKESVLDPLNKTWWSEGDEPWQILAACTELVKAVESGDPASYESSLFCTMDGSCNGLQHYAALGRDEEGGSAVNLVPGVRPNDVYSEVMKVVIEKVENMASQEAPVLDGSSAKSEAASKTSMRDFAAATMLLGNIDRKVVKQTVMTSVYGVTYVGARAQIQGRLEEKFENNSNHRMDEEELDQAIYDASSYLATVTMDALNDLFGGARATMSFLTECASLVSQQQQPVSWITPLKLPCVQPYRRNKERIVDTVVQRVSLVDNDSDLKISSAKQRSAFPPNYVHSLDSTHMLMTAIEMKKRGLEFSAVHDSYWTHPQNIDEMNVILREKFVELYTQPLLAQLRSDLVQRFPDVNFPQVPETGELDLEGVRKSTYFFQ